MNKIRILLVSEMTLLRQGVQKLLESEGAFEIVGEAADGREAVQLAWELQPDVVVLDVALPRLNGVEATRQIVKAELPTQVLILTTNAHAQAATEALETGAAGCLLNEATGRDLIVALRAVHRGESFLSPSIAKQVIQRFINVAKGSRRSLDDAEPLTPREREILQLVAEGYSSKRIAGLLGISDKTVKSHRERLMRKLGLHKVADLVRYAIQRDLVHR